MRFARRSRKNPTPPVDASPSAARISVIKVMNLTDPRTLCLILLAVTCVFLLVRTRSQLARQRQQWATESTETGDYEGARTAASSLLDRLPDDLARWDVEMHETARQLSAQLDAKLSLLQSLIAEADRAAARLENALGCAYPTLPPGSQAESLRPGGGALARYLARSGNCHRGVQWLDNRLDRWHNGRRRSAPGNGSCPTPQ